MSTNYRSQNFHHLEEIDPALAVLGTHAERYFVDDANTALIKTRQFAERLTQVLAEQSGTVFEQRDSFADLLRKIRLDGAAPPEILDLLHRIRISGNDAVHGFDRQRRLAFDTIKVCHRLGVWLRATITRSPGLTMAFHPPRSAGNDATELRQRIVILEEDLAARSTEAERTARELARFQQVALDAEARAKLAEEE